MNKWEELLRDYGFVPWQGGGMTGWHRHTDFVKDCLAGEIARYAADDFIILDRARGQEGTNRADKSGDVISRNIDATLYSASLNASYNFLTSHLNKYRAPWAVAALTDTNVKAAILEDSGKFITL